MATYADMAAKGPKQTNAEKVPDPIPEIEHSDSGVHSIDSSDFSGSHESHFPSYAEQQKAKEQADEAAFQAERAADRAAQDAKEFTAQAEAELQRLEKEAGTKYDQFSADAKASYEKWKKEADKGYHKAKKEVKKDAKKVKEESKEAGRWADKNKENPVVIGNVIAVAALGGLLGIGAYRLHQRNELTWKVAGAWAGIVGLFAVGDYYVSQFFFKKYPPKQ